MNAPASLRDQQLAFADHVREGGDAPFAGIEARRMAIYQRLVRGNLESLLEANFPVLQRTLAAERWQGLVEGFLREHRSETPLFAAIGEEFIAFLESRDDPGDPPWLAELAHWEWLELAAQLAPFAETNTVGDMLEEIPLIDPGVRIAAYAWPVQRIGPDFQPAVPPPQATLLMVRRDATGAMRFSELSPLVFRLVEWLQEDRGASGRAVLERLADAAAANDRAALLRDATTMLERLRDEGVIHATRGPDATG